MRSTKEAAARNREKVLKTAASLFREHGYDGIGIAAIMKASGMTNGAFYKQFKDKDRLIAEATACALEENISRWEKIAQATSGDVLQSLTAWYLSEEHLSHRDQGCSYAALGADAARNGADVQGAMEEALLSTIQIINTGTETNEQAIRFLSRLVGALVLSRAVGNSDLRDRILDANIKSIE